MTPAERARDERGRYVTVFTEEQRRSRRATYKRKYDAHKNAQDRLRRQRRVATPFDMV